MEQGLGFSIPHHHGYDVVHAIQAMVDESVDVFFCMGGISSPPPPIQTLRQSTPEGWPHGSGVDQIKPLSSRPGKNALILPCLGRTERDIQASGEQFVSVENSMGIVHRSTGGLQASDDLKSEPAIVASIAEKTLGSTHLEWTSLVEDYDRIRELMEASLHGFEQYNSAFVNPTVFLAKSTPG